jgi:hypothetical protein
VRGGAAMDSRLDSAWSSVLSWLPAYTGVMSSKFGYAAVRPHVLPASLDELAGPAVGEMVLPARLDWGPERSYSLTDLSDARLLYERVIREALNVEDLRAFLNRDLLLRLWPDLFLPAQVRSLWERAFPLPRLAASA